MRNLARCLMGALWSLLGVAKLLSPEAFIRYLGGFLPEPGLAAHFVIAFEVVLGACALAAALQPVELAGRRAFSGAVAAASVIAVFAGLAAAFLLPEEHGCGCFGAMAAATFNLRLVVLGVLLFLSVAAWPAPRSPGCEGRALDP